MEGASGVRVEAMSEELARHGVIGKLGKRAEPLQIFKVERRVAFGLNRGQIESRSLHEERRSLLPENIAESSLDGGVATAMQHERFVTA